MSLQLGQTRPISAPIDHHRRPHPFPRMAVGGKWAVLFSHPQGYTPARTTELREDGPPEAEFDKRGVQVIGLSVDTLDRHVGWKPTSRKPRATPNFPIIADSASPGTVATSTT